MICARLFGHSMALSIAVSQDAFSWRWFASARSRSKQRAGLSRVAGCAAPAAGSSGSPIGRPRARANHAGKVPRAFGGGGDGVDHRHSAGRPGGRVMWPSCNAGGVRKLEEPPTDSNPDLSAPTAVHTLHRATPLLCSSWAIVAAGPQRKNHLQPPVPPPSSRRHATASSGDTADTGRVPSNHLLSPRRKHRGR